MGKRAAWFVGPLVGERGGLCNVERRRTVVSKQMAKEPVKKNGIVYAVMTHPSRPNARLRATAGVSMATTISGSANRACTMPLLARGYGIASRKTVPLLLVPSS